MFTGTQLTNYPLEERTEKVLGSVRSKQHTDPNDDATRISLLYCLDNIPADYHSGRFNITDARLSFPLETLSITAFSARKPHFSSGAGYFPASTSEEMRRTESLYIPQLVGEEYAEGKYHGIRFPREHALTARPYQVNDSLFTERAVTNFGTKARHQEWQMIWEIKTNIVAVREKNEAGDVQTPESFVEKYKWKDAETGEWTYPSVEVAAICLEEAIPPLPANPSEEAKAAYKKADKTWGKYNNSFLWTTAGDAVPPPEDPNDLENRRRRYDKQYKENKSNNGGKGSVVCGVIGIGKDKKPCGRRSTHPTGKCRSHRGGEEGSSVDSDLDE